MLTDGTFPSQNMLNICYENRIHFCDLNLNGPALFYALIQHPPQMNPKMALFS